MSQGIRAFLFFANYAKNNISSAHNNSLPNGILYLKGGEFAEEIRKYEKNITIYHISEFFEEEFFSAKKVVYLPIA